MSAYTTTGAAPHADVLPVSPPAAPVVPADGVQAPSFVACKENG